MKSIHGFTLFELIVVILIIAIISVFAVPAMSTFFLRQNLTSSAQDLVMTLNKARSKAALERRLVTVNLNPLSSTTDSIDVLVWRPSGKSSLVSSDNTVVFRADGMIQASTTATSPRNSDITFVICDQAQARAKYSKRVVVSRMGVVQQLELVQGGCNAS